MSVTEYVMEPDERYWSNYLLACRVEKATPSLSDFMVWLEEQEVDTDDTY